ncbi:MAG: hypothetical protein PHO08_11175 [Methylococcales bacterium]|nr:hypothetical protein [Methylococcales bacterium]MDD5633289.1 hypothetical protein [Methylococcales bacterium]
MATLIGYAIPLTTPMPGINQLADHTYVRTADGRGVWGCWGRSDGGSEICRGSGSSKQADCYSQPWGTSGIIYGVTGVCHQTANRILYPARVIVSGAHGYWLSSLVYGTYGDAASWAAQRLRCYWTGGDKAMKAQLKAMPEEEANIKHAAPQSKEDLGYTTEIMALYEEVAQAPEKFSAKEGAAPAFLSRELEIAIKIKLGKQMDTGKTKATIQLQNELHQEMNKLVDELYSEEISTVEYANQANRLFNKKFKLIGAEIGKDNYQKLFAIAPGVKLSLINPDVMAKPYKIIDM